MAVPFEQLGPGQSGRLVYQVLGKNGPIYNPAGIRYLPPDAPSDIATGDAVGPLLTGLAGANLLVGAGTLVLQAATLRGIQRVEERFEQVQHQLGCLEANVARVVDKVDRIEAKVSENNLRHATQHLLKRSVDRSSIDLRQLSRLKNDIRSFISSLDDWGFGGVPGLRLSADVHDQLTHIHDLFLGVRTTVALWHNRQVGGDPRYVLRVTPAEHFPVADETAKLAAALKGAAEVAESGVSRLASDVQQRFTWASDEDEAYYNQLGSDAIFVPVVEAIGAVDASALTVAMVLKEPLAATADATERVALCQQYLRWWLVQTDAGLIFKLLVELLTFEAGYDKWIEGEVGLVLENAPSGVAVEVDLGAALAIGS